MAHSTTSSPVPSRPSHGRALQDTTNVRPEPSTNTNDEALDMDLKVDVEIGGEDSESSSESIGKQNAANSSPISPIGNVTPPPEPSPLELPSPSQGHSGQTTFSSLTRTHAEPISTDQTSLSAAILPGLTSLSIQDLKTSPSLKSQNNSVIFLEYKDLEPPASNSTWRMDFDCLEDPHTQAAIENARNRLWPMRLPVRFDGDDDDYGDQEAPEACNVTRSSNKAIFYPSIDNSGQILGHISPSPSPLGSLPVLRSWTSSQLRDELAIHYSNGSWMKAYAREERWNPYPGVDMNLSWQRLYYKTADFFLTNENRISREKEFKQQEKRVRICESFAHFSWTRQLGPRVFNIGLWRGGKFDFWFRGDESMHRAWSREPGSWWNARKRLFELPTSLSFHDAVDRETKFIVARVKDIVLEWNKYEPYKRLRVLSRKRPCPESESSLEEIIELKGSKTETHGIFELREDESLPKEQLIELRGRPGEESSSVPRFKKQFREYRQGSWSKKWTGRSEEWREQRRAQEKKAGRWTDGTVRMNRMWEEYHWVCDDSGTMTVIQRPYR